MPAKLDYQWHLRKVMADRGMFATTDLIAPLQQRGISLSSSQVYRLVVERPERLSLKVLVALLDILDCTLDDLIEPVAPATARGSPAEESRVELKPASGVCGPSGHAFAAPSCRDHIDHGRAVTDPVEFITELVVAVDDRLALEEIRAVVSTIAGGRAKSRRLAAFLADHSAVLRDGRSPAPQGDR